MTGNDKGKRLLAMPVAVFNGHVNDAAAKAKEVFIRHFGQEGWDVYLQAHEEQGIMSVFNAPPTFHVMFYVTLVTAIANGDVDVIPGFTYEEFEVEVQRTVSTTLRINAKNESSAALIADSTTTSLPGFGDGWEPADGTGWHYVVRAADGTRLYSGDAQELQ